MDHIDRAPQTAAGHAPLSSTPATAVPGVLNRPNISPAMREKCGIFGGGDHPFQPAKLVHTYTVPNSLLGTMQESTEMIFGVYEFEVNQDIIDNLTKVVGIQVRKNAQMIHSKNLPALMRTLYVSVGWQANGTEFIFGPKNTESSCPYFLLGYMFQDESPTKAWYDISMENCQFRLVHSTHLQLPALLKLMEKGIFTFIPRDWKDKNTWKKMGEMQYVKNGHDSRIKIPTAKESLRRKELDKQILLGNKDASILVHSFYSTKRDGTGLPSDEDRYAELKEIKAISGKQKEIDILKETIQGQGGKFGTSAVPENIRDDSRRFANEIYKESDSAPASSAKRGVSKNEDLELVSIRRKRSREEYEQGIESAEVAELKVAVTKLEEELETHKTSILEEFESHKTSISAEMKKTEDDFKAEKLKLGEEYLERELEKQKMKRLEAKLNLELVARKEYTKNTELVLDQQKKEVVKLKMEVKDQEKEAEEVMNAILTEERKERKAEMKKMKLEHQQEKAEMKKIREELNLLKAASAKTH